MFSGRGIAPPVPIQESEQSPLKRRLYSFDQKITFELVLKDQIHKAGQSMIVLLFLSDDIPNQE